MVAASKNILNQLKEVLLLITQDEYQSSLSIFSNASISQHVRHILEFYICLLDCKGEYLNFDKRKRDKQIESHHSFTLQSIEKIIQNLDSLNEDRAIKLEACLNSKHHIVDTTIHRELLYVIEHAVHHMAIIKMGIMLHFPKVKIAENFGVAESTIAYRNQCAQ